MAASAPVEMLSGAQWLITLGCGSVGGASVWLYLTALQKSAQPDYMDLIGRIVWGALAAVFVVSFAPEIGLFSFDAPRKLIGISLAAGLGVPGLQVLGARLGVDVRTTLRLFQKDRRNDDSD